MGTTDRSLSLLKLFTLERPAWTAEAAALALDVSISTAYRYLLALENIGLITATRPGLYVLGPAIIQLDRQIQLTDPLLISARPTMTDLIAYAPSSSVVLLCRFFNDQVLCMHQVLSDGPAPKVSYDRGRPMPMFRGATSKIILSFLPPRRLKAVFISHRLALQQAGLGDTWESFKANMARLRKTGYAVSFGEIDQGCTGIGVAILGADNYAIGSLSYVLTSEFEQRKIVHLASLLQAGAREIASALHGDQTTLPAPPDTDTQQKREQTVKLD